MRPGRTRPYAAVVSVLLASGCVRSTHPNGTDFCGVRLPTGAEQLLPTPVDPSVAAPGPAPASSRLPPPLPDGQAVSPHLTLVRTSRDCDHGAVVTVTPVDGAYLYRAVDAKGGGIAGLALSKIARQVTVSSWIGGHYQGSLVLTPHLSTTTSSSIH